MRLVFFLIVSLGMLSLSTQAQTNNFRAQGYYYKAKDYYVANSFNEAIEYVIKSKEALGGTNKRLQYLHIMTLVKQSEWVMADEQMKIFYEIVEGTKEARHFSNEVDELTQDETYELTKILVDIEENAAYESSDEGKKAKREQKMKDLFNQIFNTYASGTSDLWGIKDSYKYETSYSWQGEYICAKQKTITDGVTEIHTAKFKLTDIKTFHGGPINEAINFGPVFEDKRVICSEKSENVNSIFLVVNPGLTTEESWVLIWELMKLINQTNSQ